jgi:hypothetical protein
MRLNWNRGLAIGVAIAASLLAPAAFGATKCTMKFSLSGWSAFYQTAHGSGTITCDNGQSASVSLSTKGGGLTFGTSKVANGSGDFSEVSTIGDVFGNYAKAEAHAGMGASSDAQVLTKGTVSLALHGTGEGINVGFDFGRLTIGHAKHAKK